MERNREPQNGPTQIEFTALWQRSKSYSMEKEQSFQQMMLEQVDVNMHAKSKNNLARDFTPLIKN